VGVQINVHFNVDVGTWVCNYVHFDVDVRTWVCNYTVCLRSLRKLINFLAGKRKFLLILGGLSELTLK